MQSEPIFITGPDRSGTSLMFALIASHPNISMVRRSNMWRWFYDKYGDLKNPQNFERCLDTMLRYKRLQPLQPDPERIRREFWEGEPSYGRLFALFHQHCAERRGRPRWGDKSLHTEHYADAIYEEFPRARIIHMIRDPRDRYASVLKRYEDQEKALSTVTMQWTSSVSQARRNQTRYANRYMTVRYETLAMTPEKTLHQVCAFIGEDYIPEMLSMRGAPEHGESGGNSSFGRFKPGTISTKAIGRYRQVLTRREVAFIQACAGREMKQFDYTPESLDLSLGDRTRFYAIDLPLNLTRMVGRLTANKISKARGGQTVPGHRLIKVEGT